jgi:BASS family bile acid:Na+ symporter
MHVLGTWITVLSAAYLVCMMFALGLELGGGPKESKEQKRAKRRMLLRGLILNLVVLPLVAFGITRAAHAPREVTIALLLLAAAPGGRFAPHLVRLGGGDIALAVEVTVFLAKITCFTAVLSAKWMLTLRALEIRELPIIAQLVVLQLVPFYLGKWLGRAHGSTADRLLKPARWVAIAVLLAGVPAVLLRDDRGILALLDTRSWVAVLAVVVVSPVVGRLFAGRHDAERRTFAIGANCRELALATSGIVKFVIIGSSTFYPTISASIQLNSPLTTTTGAIGLTQWQANLYQFSLFQWLSKPQDIDGDGEVTLIDAYKFAGVVTIERIQEVWINSFSSLRSRQDELAAAEAKGEPQVVLDAFRVTIRQIVSVLYNIQEPWLLHARLASQIGFV